LLYQIYRIGEIDDGKIEGLLFFLNTAQGPPGFVHGGCLATVIDEALGISYGHGIFTLQLNMVYKKPCPLQTTVRLTACVTKTQDIGRGRIKVWCKATISNLTMGDAYCEGTGLFLFTPVFSQPAPHLSLQQQEELISKKRLSLTAYCHDNGPEPADVYFTQHPSFCELSAAWSSSDPFVCALAGNSQLRPHPSNTRGPGYCGGGKHIMQKLPFRVQGFLEGKAMVQMYWDTPAEKGVTACCFLQCAEGPPGFVHGGAIATLLDDASFAHPSKWGFGGSFTASLSVQYHKAVPALTTLVVETTVDRTEPTKSGKMVKEYVTVSLKSVDLVDVFAVASALLLCPQTPLPNL
jgi:acyl-coenzyme A thioesterase PaaI-like protein